MFGYIPVISSNLSIIEITFKCTAHQIYLCYSFQGVDNFVFSHDMILDFLQEVLKIDSDEALVVEILFRIVF